MEKDVPKKLTQTKTGPLVSFATLPVICLLVRRLVPRIGAFVLEVSKSIGIA